MDIKLVIYDSVHHASMLNRVNEYAAKNLPDDRSMVYATYVSVEGNKVHHMTTVYFIKERCRERKDWKQHVKFIQSTVFNGEVFMYHVDYREVNTSQDILTSVGSYQLTTTTALSKDLTVECTSFYPFYEGEVSLSFL